MDIIAFNTAVGDLILRLSAVRIPFHINFLYKIFCCEKVEFGSVLKFLILPLAISHIIFTIFG